MKMIEQVLGNVHESPWREILAEAQVDVLELDQWEAQKNRLRKETRSGESLAVSLDRGVFLRDGDVLLWNEENKTAVICSIALCEVLVVELDALASLPAAELVERCVRLGHALGNQHWPAVVLEGKVYVPLSVAEKVMLSVMNTHHFEGLHYYFVPGAEVAPLLPPAQARRLFGGSERPLEHHHHHDDEMADRHDHHHGGEHEHHDGQHHHYARHDDDQHEHHHDHKHKKHDGEHGHYHHAEKEAR